MSAVEALAEVLRGHYFMADYDCCDACDGDFHEHVAHIVVAAIRSMPAEQVAELIGGEVEHRPVHDCVPGCHWDAADRVVTPWTSPAVLGLRKIEPEPKEQQ